MKKTYQSPALEAIRISVVSVVCVSAENEEIIGKPVDPWG